MTDGRRSFVGAPIFDGTRMVHDHALVVEGAAVLGIVPEADTSGRVERLEGGTLCPGFVDLQVNGGGGVLLNDDPSPATIHRIVEAHARQGATSILPTLITDTTERTDAAIEAAISACVDGMPGVIGLHLEGPHLSVEKKGAHAADLIRPMEETDLRRLCEAAARLPVLKVTVAPENVSVAQIEHLTQAGILVSLGHTNADYTTCRAAMAAGARVVTHLFNAMSQMGSRQPGLVGACLDTPEVSAGLIADGIHVHPASIRTALRAKTGPGRCFLVSDAMAVTGTADDSFELNNRRVLRRDGRLTLEDGTLAGADITLLQAIRNLIAWGAATEEEALAMATSIPGALCGGAVGRLWPGAPADFVHLVEGEEAPRTVWRGGALVG